MVNNSKYMNSVYSDMNDSLPKAFFMDIPKEIGNGKIKSMYTGQGIVLSDWKMNYLSDVNVEGVNSDKFIQLMFCLSGEAFWEVEGDSRTYEIKKGEMRLWPGSGKNEYMCYKKNTDFEFRTIKLPLEYYNRIIEGYLDEDKENILSRGILENESNMPLTPYVDFILEQLDGFKEYQGFLSDMYLDGKILELLTVYLKVVFDEGHMDKRYSDISKTDRGALIEAKKIIDSCEDRIPTCKELASAVNLSVSKFSKIFSKVYDKPVHSYIVEKRLENAAYMLIKTDMSIGEIAFKSGYSKPSNFSAAFKKRYGVLPKEYRTDFGYN